MSIILDKYNASLAAAVLLAVFEQSLYSVIIQLAAEWLDDQLHRGRPTFILLFSHTYCS